MGLNALMHAGGHMVPNKVHSRQANQGKVSYHNRIQKKWRKRFGQKYVETVPRGTMYKFGNTLVIRPDDYSELMGVVNA